MKKLRLGLLLDIARLARPSARETLKLLQSRHNSRPPFTYSIARDVAMALWSSELGLAAAETAVKQAKMSELGKECNLEIVRELHKQAKPFQGICVRVPPEPYFISRDTYIPIPIDFYFTQGGIPQLFVLQPRRSHAPNLRALGLIAGLIEEVYVPDVFEVAELHLFDLRAVDGKRTPKVFRFSDLPRLSQEEIRQLLEAYMQAYELYVKWAATQQNRDSTARQKPSEDHPDLFDAPRKPPPKQ